MKKTLTVNLGGTVYHIDEDAYKLLDTYLSNLRIHFCREEGAEEIVHDMELRISELFTDRLRDGKQVITIEDVEEIIAQMGKPEDLGDEADGGGETSKDGSTYSQTAKGPRRLFRDSDNKVLGGVASGLAAYFGWDPTWVRIIFLILGISLKGFVIAYIIAWIVIPLARTVPEKLAMRGAKINVENIGRTVTDNFEKVNEYVHSGKPHSALQRIGEGIVGVAGALIKFILIVLAICCAPIVFVIFVVCFGHVNGGNRIDCCYTGCSLRSVAGSGLECCRSISYSYYRLGCFRHIGYWYSYHRIDTYPDASFRWLATHVYCYPDYLYRAVVYSFVCRLRFFLSNTPFIGCLIYQ